MTTATIAINGFATTANLTTFITVPEDDYDCALNTLRDVRDERPWVWATLGAEQRAQLDRMLDGRSA
jgi:hypothetical protein